MNASNAVSNSQKRDYNKKVDVFSVRGLTVMALLSAISFVLMLFDIPLPFAPNFYQIDFSEVPVLIGAFALGPVAGVIIELVKILLNLLLQGSDTIVVGEIANFILGCSLVVPAAMIYLKRTSKKAAILGLCIGTIAMTVAGSLLNAYVLLPTYAALFKMPIDNLVAMGTAVNPSIDSLMTFVLLAVVPFNLLKGIVVSIVTIVLYKYVSPVIKGYHNK